MLFNSIEFIIFLIVVFVASWLLARWRMVQLVILLAASYFFYANWNPYYLILIFGTSTVDFLLGRWIHRTQDLRRRRLMLAASLVTDLGVLATFKYFNFFAVQVAASINALGYQVDPLLLDVLLPVGISFFTFQSMSYTIDIYRRKLEPTSSYLEYLLFVSFFPQLVAGPIVRASQFLPQLRQPRTLSLEEGGRAIFLIMSGVVKKVCIADYVAVNLVDRVFENPSWFTSAEVLVAVYGYAFQIYCDFSGYTDVAIGAALLLGFQLPENFRSPYAAVNLRDFWRRWHISLSTWLRDYLYIPLGGSKRGPARTYVALAATMLLGGLWHGAAWTFVVWGALHGGALAVTRAWQRWRGEGPGSRIGRILRIVLTFHFVCLAWVFFRSPGIEKAWEILGRLTLLTTGTANVPATVALALFVAAVLQYLPERAVDSVRGLFTRLPAPAQGVVMVSVGVLVQQVAQSQVVPYIYFQF